MRKNAAILFYVCFKANPPIIFLNRLKSISINIDRSDVACNNSTSIFVIKKPGPPYLP